VGEQLTLDRMQHRTQEGPLAAEVVPGRNDRASVLGQVVRDSSDRRGAPAAEHVGEDRAALVL
jgi:hypothetical protein